MSDAPSWTAFEASESNYTSFTYPSDAVILASAAIWFAHEFPVASLQCRWQMLPDGIELCLQDRCPA